MLVNGIDFSVGADPEVFLGKGSQFVSAHDQLPGDKGNPHKVDKGAVQVDGMAAEFNIDPANDFEGFKGNLDTVQGVMKSMIGDLNFIEDTSVFFDEVFVSQIPPENLVLGCEPDFNGWTMENNPSPEETTMMRTAGGHVHVGGFNSDSIYSGPHFEAGSRLARILDETLGVYSVLWDKDDNRRSMYGKAGCFRPKTYGMEYRTLSNKWIFSDKLVHFVWEGVKEALEKMFDPNHVVDNEIRDIIDSSDRDSHFFQNNPKVKLLGV
jgi:hypothetical protein